MWELLSVCRSHEGGMPVFGHVSFRPMGLFSLSLGHLPACCSSSRSGCPDSLHSSRDRRAEKCAAACSATSWSDIGNENNNSYHSVGSKGSTVLASLISLTSDITTSLHFCTHCIQMSRASTSSLILGQPQLCAMRKLLPSQPQTSLKCFYIQSWSVAEQLHGREQSSAGPGAGLLAEA